VGTKKGGSLIPIYQTRTGAIGNCLAACLASICEAPLPEFGLPSDPKYDCRMTTWLAERGLRYQQVSIGDPAPVGWMTIEGVSPRGGQHACVAFNGRLRFDPHKPDGSGRGLIKVERYGLLLPINHAAVNDAPPPYAPGDMIALPNGRRTRVTKCLPRRDLFGNSEWHVSTATGEVLVVPVRKGRQ
jgi:hypothetical protein